MRNSGFISSGWGGANGVPALQSLKKWSCAVMLLSALPMMAVPTAKGADEIAREQFNGSTITLHPTVNYESVVLTVAGPDGLVSTEKFPKGPPPTFSVAPEGGALSDGVYNYELTVIPFIPPGAKEAMRKSRKSGDMTEVRNLRAAGVIPKERERMIQSGHFRVLGGSIVQPAEEEESP
jgi:hypothetical protein